MLDSLENFFSKEYNQLVLWCPVALISGVLCCEAFGSNTIVCFSVIILILATYGLHQLYKQKLTTFFFLSVISIFFVLGILTYKIHQQFTNNLPQLSLSDVDIIGEIYNIKPTSHGSANVYLNVGLIASLGQKNIPSKIQMRIPYKHVQDVMVGDVIIINAQKLETPFYKIFPHGYDAERQAKYDRIGAVGFTFSEPQKIKTQKSFNFFDYVHKVRKFIYHKFLDSMGKETGNFASAIVLGEQKGISRNLLQNMRYAGISHILCVSGLHLSLVAMISFVTIRFLLNLSDVIAFNLNIKKVSSIIALVCSFLYWCISGMQIAATRAFIMTSVVMISMTFGRVPDPMRSLGLAATIMVMLNPQDVFHPSFQLSFTAVVSLIAGYELYMKYKIYLGSSKGIFGKLKMYILGNVYTSILASIATAPIVVYYFFFFSNYTILANLIAVPVMSFIMMPLALLSLMLMILGWEHTILSLLSSSISVVISVADSISTMPYSLWYVGSISNYGLALFMFGFMWLVIWKTRIRLYGLVVIIISLCLMLIKTRPDAMIDFEHGIVGINENEQLRTYGGRKSEKIAMHWTRWFGQKEVIFNNKDKKDIYSKTKDGTSIYIARQNLVCNGDFIINMINNESCPQNTLLLRDVVLLDKFMIFCKNKECHTEPQRQ